MTHISLPLTPSSASKNTNSFSLVISSCIPIHNPGVESPDGLISTNSEVEDNVPILFHNSHPLTPSLPALTSIDLLSNQFIESQAVFIPFVFPNEKSLINPLLSGCEQIFKVSRTSSSCSNPSIPVA